MTAPDFCYWLAVAFKANNSADFACVFAIADFAINPARAGMQTHISFMDLLRRTPWDWEPMATTAIRVAVKRARRLVGLMG
jgi:hypothetical protein